MAITRTGRLVPYDFEAFTLPNLPACQWFDLQLNTAGELGLSALYPINAAYIIRDGDQSTTQITGVWAVGSRNPSLLLSLSFRSLNSVRLDASKLATYGHTWYAAVFNNRAYDFGACVRPTATCDYSLTITAGPPLEGSGADGPSSTGSVPSVVPSSDSAAPLNDVGDPGLVAATQSSPGTQQAADIQAAASLGHQLSLGLVSALCIMLAASCSALGLSAAV